jgi:hypothetical protein
MTTPADIFEALAQLPDRTPAQRAVDERSAAILRFRREHFPHYDEEPETWTSDEVEDIVAERVMDVLHELIEELPAGSKRARELLQARVMEVAEP